MKKYFLPLLLLVSASAAAHDLPPWEYICSVSQMRPDGKFNDVVNVVFLPEWQQKSHLYHTDTVDIFFELVPVKNYKDEEVDREMTITFKRADTGAPMHVTTGSRHAEIDSRDYELQLAARCFHRSMRGQL
jgi:hypothetical protein